MTSFTVCVPLARPVTDASTCCASRSDPEPAPETVDTFVPSTYTSALPSSGLVSDSTWSPVPLKVYENASPFTAV